MADKEDFKRELQDRLSGIEKGLAEVLAVVKDIQSKPSTAPAAGTTNKRSNLTEIQTKEFRVDKVYSDKAGAAAKWNCSLKDEAGTKYRIGTFDKGIADTVLLAEANKAKVTITFGKNKNGYYDAVSAQ